MNLQITRGCPFACDFCEITSLFGHKVRMKDPEQVIRELDALYESNWRGAVFIVDDNFIGNKKQVKYQLLPAMRDWMQEHNNPFIFNTQTSIDLADDKELMRLMIQSGFTSTFIGIETPDEQTLQACNKVQNKKRDLLQSVKEIQKNGLQVSGGFIVGFDSDSPTVFQRQIDFIQQSGIVSAMVGLLNAPRNTRLYERLEAENRLTEEATGNNTDLFMNFKPKMDLSELLEGYKLIIRNIYGTKPYYKRIRQFLMNYRQQPQEQRKLAIPRMSAFIKIILIIGILNKGRAQYWKFLFWTLFHRPRLFIDAMTFAVYGYHFRTVYGV